MPIFTPNKEFVDSLIPAFRMAVEPMAGNVKVISESSVQGDKRNNDNEKALVDINKSVAVLPKKLGDQLELVRAAVKTSSDRVQWSNKLLGIKLDNRLEQIQLALNRPSQATAINPFGKSMSQSGDNNTDIDIDRRRDRKGNKGGKGNKTRKPSKVKPDNIKRPSRKLSKIKRPNAKPSKVKPGLLKKGANLAKSAGGKIAGAAVGAGSFLTGGLGIGGLATSSMGGIATAGAGAMAGAAGLAAGAGAIGYGVGTAINWGMEKLTGSDTWATDLFTDDSLPDIRLTSKDMRDEGKIQATIGLLKEQVKQKKDEFWTSDSDEIEIRGKEQQIRILQSILDKKKAQSKSKPSKKSTKTKEIPKKSSRKGSPSVLGSVKADSYEKEQGLTPKVSSGKSKPSNVELPKLDPKIVAKELEKQGIIDLDWIGNSEIEDWSKIEALPSNKIKALLDYKDWSNDDTKRLQDLYIKKSSKNEVIKETEKLPSKIDSVKPKLTNVEAYTEAVSEEVTAKSDIKNFEEKHGKAKVIGTDKSGFIDRYGYKDSPELTKEYQNLEHKEFSAIGKKRKVVAKEIDNQIGITSEDKDIKSGVKSGRDYGRNKRRLDRKRTRGIAKLNVEKGISDNPNMITVQDRQQLNSAIEQELLNASKRTAAAVEDLASHGAKKGSLYTHDIYAEEQGEELISETQDQSKAIGESKDETTKLADNSLYSAETAKTLAIIRERNVKRSRGEQTDLDKDLEVIRQKESIKPKEKGIDWGGIAKSAGDVFGTGKKVLDAGLATASKFNIGGDTVQKIQNVERDYYERPKAQLQGQVEKVKTEGRRWDNVIDDVMPEKKKPVFKPGIKTVPSKRRTRESIIFEEEILEKKPTIIPPTKLQTTKPKLAVPNTSGVSESITPESTPSETNMESLKKSAATLGKGLSIGEKILNAALDTASKFNIGGETVQKIRDTKRDYYERPKARVQGQVEKVKTEGRRWDNVIDDVMPEEKKTSQPSIYRKPKETKEEKKARIAEERVAQIKAHEERKQAKKKKTAYVNPKIRGVVFTDDETEESPKPKKKRKLARPKADLSWMDDEKDVVLAEHKKKRRAGVEKVLVTPTKVAPISSTKVASTPSTGLVGSAMGAVGGMAAAGSFLPGKLGKMAGSVTDQLGGKMNAAGLAALARREAAYSGGSNRDAIIAAKRAQKRRPSGGGKSRVPVTFDKGKQPPSRVPVTFDDKKGKRPSRVPVTLSQHSKELGALSERYESGGRGAGVVSTGRGDYGGVSYGTYQMTSKGGKRSTASKFAKQSKWADQFEGLQAGSKEFSAKWKQIAKDDPSFKEAQHGYIKKTHYDPLAKKTAEDTGLDVNSRSKALQDVVWSTGVQHGSGTNVMRKALAGKDAASMTDDEIIKAVYAERGKTDAQGNLARFKSSSKGVQKGVANRYGNEQADALAALEKEQISKEPKELTDEELEKEFAGMSSMDRYEKIKRRRTRDETSEEKHDKDLAAFKKQKKTEQAKQKDTRGKTTKTAAQIDAESGSELSQIGSAVDKAIPLPEGTKSKDSERGLSAAGGLSTMAGLVAGKVGLDNIHKIPKIGKAAGAVRDQLGGSMNISGLAALSARGMALGEGSGLNFGDMASSIPGFDAAMGAIGLDTDGPAGGTTAIPLSESDQATIAAKKSKKSIKPMSVEDVAIPSIPKLVPITSEDSPPTDPSIIKESTQKKEEATQGRMNTFLDASLGEQQKKTTHQGSGSISSGEGGQKSGFTPEQGFDIGIAVVSAGLL